MIGSLRGTLLEKNAPDVLIEVGGVGYEVSMPMTSFYELPAEGQEVFIYTSFIVREDAHLIYGFTTREAKLLFRKLLKVNGVGPKMALAVLSTLTPAEFVGAVQRGEAGSLVKVPGVGKKTAERIVLDLKDKSTALGALLSGKEEGTDLDLTGELAETVSAARSNEEEQAIAALVALGYKPNIAESLIDKVKTPGSTVEALIRDALKSQK